MKSTECPEFYILFGTLGTNQENELGPMSRILYIFRDILALTHSANTLWRNVSVMGVHLSEDMTDLIEEQTSDFSSLSGDVNAVEALQETMLEPLCQYGRQVDCSGAFERLKNEMFYYVSWAGVLYRSIYQCSRSIPALVLRETYQAFSWRNESSGI